MVVVFIKEGYYPKQVELTSGPHLWRSINGKNTFIYYTLDHEYTITLSPIGGVAPLKKEKPEIAFGTGFHCEQWGYIVTNFHVIEDARDIILVRDDKRCSASIVASTLSI